MNIMKIKKILILVLGLFIVCSCLYFSFKERKIAIFAYHKIVPQEIKNEYYKDNKWVDTVERFEEQMKYLYENNYKTISMSEFENWRNTDKRYPIKTVMITIDDGDLGIYYEILPILKKYNFKATMFIIGDKINDVSEEYNPKKQQFIGRDLLDYIKKEYPNLEIQSHSFSLHNPDAKDLSFEEVKKDFIKMREFETDIFCYPYGVDSEKIKQGLKENNYRMSFMLDKSNLSSKNDDKYKISRIGINYDTSFSNFKKWLIKQFIM